MVENLSNIHNNTHLSDVRAKDEVSSEILMKAEKDNSSILSAIVDYIEENNLTEEDIVEYLNTTLMEQLKYECVKLRLIDEKDAGCSILSRSIMEYL